MNNQSPLIPQGSLLEQKNKGRARVKIAVFFVLAVHGIGLMALLMQGCRQEKPAADQDTNTTAAASMDATNAPVADTNPPPVAAMTNAPVPPEIATPQPQPPPAATATEYTIVKNDTLAGIAKKLGVKTQALIDANPGVQPTKLQIGQKLKVPAAAAAPSAAASGSAATPADTSNGEQTYTVKSGDVLYNIAKAHGTTVKALRAANNLKTDRIVVGQKLKLPPKTAAPESGTAATSSPPVAPGQ